jgi:dephospho-CoA kinase
MIVGLTGGIGSGKSTVAKLFSVLGVPVYDTDRKAKEMYYDPLVKDKVIHLLGEEAYDKTGKIDRTFIASRIFSDKELLQKVNAVIHPAVGKDFENFLRDHADAKMIIKESALLFEAGLKDKMDKIVLVTSPLEVRIERLLKRDRATREQILSRIENQLPDEEKIAKSDFIIYNDEVQALIPQVLKIHQKLSHA